MRTLWLFCLLAVNLAQAAETEILRAAERHARILAAEHAGKVSIESGPLDASRLPPCEQLESYTPPGSRSLGRTQIGIRCTRPSPWNILVPVKISVVGPYVTTTRALLAGQTLSASDLRIQSGDLAGLPTGSIDDPARVLGKTLRNSVGAGQILRQNQILSPKVVRQGHNVKVVISSSAFSATAEGRALNSAAPGEPVRVRMESGRTVSGNAREDGTVEITN